MSFPAESSSAWSSAICRSKSAGHACTWRLRAVPFSQTGSTLPLCQAPSIAKLKRYVGRVGEADGLEKFRAEFARMEKAITERIEKYRQMTTFMKRLLADADASLRHVPED